MYLLSLLFSALCLAGIINAAALPTACAGLSFPKHKRQQGTAISVIGSARVSAFRDASQAFAAATPQPNSIMCPGVIGAAAMPSEPPGDKVGLRVDPSAIKFLEGRQSIRPHQKHESHRGHRRTRNSGAEETGSSTATSVQLETSVTAAPDHVVRDVKASPASLKCLWPPSWLCQTHDRSVPRATKAPALSSDATDPSVFF